MWKVERLPWGSREIHAIVFQGGGRITCEADCGHRKSGTVRPNHADAPPLQEPVRPTHADARRKKIPGGTEHEVMALVKVGVAPVQPWLELTSKSSYRKISRT